MHARWIFLVATEDLEEIDRTNFVEFWTSFYHNDFLDEGNWFLPMTILHDTGEIVPLCEDGAYRGTDWLWRHLQTIPIDDRLEWLLNFTACAVARDFGVEIISVNDEGGYNYLQLSRENLLQRIDYAIGNRLEHLLKLNRGLAPPRPTGRRDETYEWDKLYGYYGISKFLGRYKQWIEAKDNDNRYNMFGTQKDIRCGYRAIQVDDAGYGTAPVSLVVVDYHY